jgi:hypothetical protein
VPFAWLASIRPDPSGDLKPLTKRLNWTAKEPDLAVLDGPLGALVGHCSSHPAHRRSARLPPGCERLAEHENVLVGDDRRAVAFGATTPRVERLPERRAQDKLVVAYRGEQADDALPVGQSRVLAKLDRLAGEVAQRAAAGNSSIPASTASTVLVVVAAAVAKFSTLIL